MYRQSIQNIKLAIISLDGVIIDLNRYRFNYYKKLCDQHQLTITKDEFNEQLSNMYDMYKSLPLASIYESGVLNAQIERELLQYLSYKSPKAKEGVLELIEYFNQRNIKIAIISSHHTKYAKEYIKLLKLNKKIDYIVGSDSSFLPIPSPHIITSIIDLFHVNNHETLVLSAYRQLSFAAFKAETNIIYCKDLVDFEDIDKALSYKCVENAYEVLNCLLFDKINEEDMYSSILGMDKYSSKSELDDIYQNLLNKYHDDEEILNVVKQTYQYHLIQFEELNIKDASIKQKKHKKRFTFDDESSKDEEINNEVLEYFNKPKKETHEKPLIKPLSLEEENELSSLLSQIKTREIKIEEINKENSNPVKDYISEQTKTFEQDLTKKIKEENKENIIEESKEEKNLPLFIRIIISLGSICLTSLCITFLGVIIAVLFINVDKHHELLKILQTLFNAYYSVIEFCFKSILDTLNTFIKFIPSYNQYMNNTNISNEGMQLLNILIFNTIIVTLINLASKLWRKSND